MSHSFESAVHQLLVRKIDAELLRGAEQLQAGSVMKLGDAVATAQGYSDAVGYRRALGNVKDWCNEIIQDLLRDN